MNHPKQLRYQRLLTFTVCISFFVTASPSLFGQLFQRRPVFQQPPQYTPVYPQGVPVAQPQDPVQIQNGPIIYGQPIPVQGGQMIQGTPVQGSPVQPGVIVTTPGGPQTGNAGNVTEADLAKRLEEIKILTAENKRLEALTLDGEKQQQEVQRLQGELKKVTSELSEMQKSEAAMSAQQADEAKRLAAENKRLKALAQGNGKRKQEVQRLQGELRKAQTELSEMQKSATATPEDMNAATAATTELNGKIQQQQTRINQLGADYEKAVERNQMLTGQIKTLTDEGTSLRARLTEAESKPKVEMVELDKLTQLQSKFTTTSTALEEATQKNEAMTSEYNRLEDLYEIETAKAKNAKLNQPVETADVKTSLTADQDSTGRDLGLENQQLLALNKKAEQQNELLNRRISELEGTIHDQETATASVASNLDAGLNGDQVASAGKFNIMRWLLPFLAIGLGVGLYVFLSEEFRGTSQATITGDTRDDRKRTSGN